VAVAAVAAGPEEPEGRAVAAAAGLSLWRELRELVWQHLAALLLGTSALVLAAVLQSSKVGRLTADLGVLVLQYDGSVDPGKREALLGTLWAMLRWQAACQALSFVGGAVSKAVTAEIKKGLQLRLYAELLAKDISLFDAHKTGALAKCVDERVGKLAGLVDAAAAGLPAAASVPLTLAMMWSASPALAKANACMVFSTTASVVLVYVLGIQLLQKTVQRQRAAAAACVTESFRAVRTIHAFGAEGQLVARYRALLHAPDSLERLQMLASLLLHQVFRSLQMLITVTTYYTGTRLLAGDVAGVAAGAALLETKDLALFQQLSGQLFGGLFQLAGVAARVGSALGDVASVDEVLGSNARSMLATGGRQLGSGCRGDLELRGVTFAYPPGIRGEGAAAGEEEEGGAGGAQPPSVLDDLSLAFKPGTVTALVGRSGSGKSTVLSLIQRFYDPLAGAVLLDGVPVTELDPRWLRRQMGTVEQEPTLFALSVADNIRLGRPDATDQEVLEAAVRAGADGFVSALPRSYATVVGEQGSSLSGGQRQRIAIARAILMDPRILILDEATSALDVATEREVAVALAEVMRSRTTIVVAHRLSTVRAADRIVVLDKGRVAQVGTHAELLGQGAGMYAQLMRHQHA
jgi:ATP-binding cassette subfamily B protein